MTDVELDSPVRPGRDRFTLLAAALGLCLVSLDGALVGVALPAIIRDLRLSFTQAQWVTTVYALVSAVLLVTAWRLGDRLGRRGVLLAGVVLFLLGSVLAASADDPSTLIWGRLVQGAGGAAVLPGSLATVRAAARGRDRAVAFAWSGALVFVAAVAGALLGGWLSSSFTWPWIFLVDVVFGVVVLAGLLLSVPDAGPRARAQGLDVDGLLLSAAGFALVVFALIEGQTYGWGKPVRDFGFFGLTWSTRAASSPIPLLLLLGVALLVLFLLWERHRVRVEHAVLLDLSLFARPGFRWGGLAALALTTSVFGLLFVLPLYLVNVLDLSTLDSGVVLAVAALGALAAALGTGWLARSVAPVWIVRAGLAIAAVAMAVTALCVSPDVSPWLLGFLLACYGIGLGLAATRLAATVLADLPADAVEEGAAVHATVRLVGGALGAAVLGGVLSIALGRILPGRLGELPGLPPRAVDEVAGATRDSAGDAVAVLRGHEGTHAVVDVLARGFADATRWSLFASALVLLLGLLAALKIPARDTSASSESADTAAEVDEE
ncbi:MFS transporter [Nocardia blacklockiae]|uniref:MFS transporter n=1 Tax=Nocardia blacklockiae TaxID=480036 RepID=UPI001894D94E|nr:MFS transporter [Nocardia blacklockiae]MBF6172708.1 MFS transporter [Nocardia blacklockiae]